MMAGIRVATLSAALIVAGVSGGSAASAKTGQEIFNDAQTAFEGGKWQEAVDGYDQTLKSSKLGAPAAASIRARLANSLAHTGDKDRALAEGLRAVEAFNTLRLTHSGDLALAYFSIGEVKRAALEAGPAVAAYRQTITAADPSDDATIVRWARMAMAYAAMTSDPAVSIEVTDTLLTDKAAFNALSDQDKGTVFALRAMAELNKNGAKGAASLIEKALDATGRTTTRVSLDQTRIRSDAALIYAKLGNAELVHYYLAYSGAGHLPDGNKALIPSDPELPICGDGIGPDDLAVVEFAIGEDGRVIGAYPIYASRNGELGATFAKAVEHWRWDPSQIAKIEPFWRASVRMELRCVKRPPAINLQDAFLAAAEEWFTKANVPVSLGDPTVKALDVNVGGPPETVRLANDLIELARFPEGETSKQIDAKANQLSQDLASAHAPVDVQGYATYLIVNRRVRRAGEGYNAARATALDAAISEFQQKAGGERVAAWFQLERVIALESHSGFDQARERLAAITSLPPALLTMDDPIRTMATLHLAMLDRRTGNNAAAAQKLAEAKVEPEQCSLLNVHPLLRRGDVTSDDFPNDALRWGFEGYVRESFDIAADGSVGGIRTIIAYPPFVFGPATERAFKSFRYEPPLLGGQALGCSEQIRSVRYSIPR